MLVSIMFLTGFTLLLLTAVRPTEPPAAQDLDAALQHVMQGKAVPAMGVIVLRHGAITGEAERGVRALGGKAAVTPADCWHIGSDGKALTATMIARLVERGRLSWDEPLSRLLPGVAMNPGYTRVTLLNLFSHSAGLPHDPPDSAMGDFTKSTAPLHQQRLDYARRSLAAAPLYPPGTQQQYSNIGPVLAATAAEIATGSSYEELMRREVFVPLGMSSAAFGGTRKGQNLGHDHGTPVAGADGDNPPVMAPAGEIHLTLRDWAKFALDQMRGETGKGKLLQAATYRRLHTPVVAGTVYALGWGALPSIDGIPGPFLTHAGSNGAWYAEIVLWPSHQSGLLMAANSGEDSGADQAEHALIKLLLPALTATKR